MAAHMASSNVPRSAVLSRVFLSLFAAKSLTQPVVLASCMATIFFLLFPAPAEREALRATLCIYAAIPRTRTLMPVPRPLYESNAKRVRVNLLRFF